MWSEIWKSEGGGSSKQVCSRSSGGFDRAMKQRSINKLVWFSDVANLKKMGHFDDNSFQLRVDISKATRMLVLPGRMSSRASRPMGILYYMQSYRGPFLS